MQKRRARGSTAARRGRHRAVALASVLAVTAALLPIASGGVVATARSLAVLGNPPHRDHVSDGTVGSSEIQIFILPANTGPGLYMVYANVVTTLPGPFGGTVAIWDDTTGSKLGEGILTEFIDFGVGAVLAVGDHVIRATFSGVPPDVPPATASVTFNVPVPSVPNPPTAVTAIAGEANATVSWDPTPIVGGDPIVGYVVTSNPDARKCSTADQACTVGGLIPGTPYTFTVTATNLTGTGPSSPPSNEVIPLVAGAPTGTISIAGGAKYSASRSVLLAVPATDAGTGVATVALSNDGRSWTVRAYAPTQSWTLPSTNGTRTVWAKWRDGAGNWSAVVSDRIVLDTVAPTVSAPVVGMRVGGALGPGGSVPAMVAWTGTDVTSGIDHFVLQESVDGAPWTTIGPFLRTASLPRLLARGPIFRERVRAVDRAGNVASALGAFSLFGVSQGSSAVHYRGTWTTSTSPIWWGGTAKYASRTGATASYTFTGKSIAWVGLKAASRGRAQIYVNGALKATVDLASPTTLRQTLVWAIRYSTSATRTITIKILGTSGRPRVDIDGFIVGT